MTGKQKISYGIRHNMTEDEIEQLADELASSPAGRKASAKAIGKGRKNLSDEEQERRRLWGKNLHLIRRKREQEKNSIDTSN